MSGVGSPPRAAAEGGRSQFRLSLEAAAEAAREHGIRYDWMRRLRHLLLAGRSIESLERETPRVFARSAALFPLLETRLVRRMTVQDGAIKLLIGLVDGHAVETVVLPTARGVSVCLSSQVGCPVGCTFCASGRAGLVRNLETHEIVEQLVHARRVCQEVDRLVMMGIGEPLLNADALFAALDQIRFEGKIGPRRMIVSTVGTKGAIQRLSDWGAPATLAVSLHAPDDELRARLIPSLARSRIDRLLQETDDYIRRTGRKGLAAYTLIRAVNDSDEQARAVGNLLRGREIYLNVIPYNRVPGVAYEPVSAERARRFVDLVRANGAFATVRKTMGSAQNAACGQLRASTVLDETGGI
ncbi:MAG: 23S rRNA (adenine(2503)-C(2))-methyltransferase RlmN [Planctomycetota bacterium]